jgi:hypothetical protein
MCDEPLLWPPTWIINLCLQPRYSDEGLVTGLQLWPSFVLYGFLFTTHACTAFGQVICILGGTAVVEL